ncbi:MAG: pyridoxamine 5'-phosphate oxidase [SAR86 cluster bacterium]|uniref:Pyridoxamine 5'-phosphate oxidase n=1 Tax=SAR86 cluster bacterium TaxID=2030880 RepID=A0A2A5B7H7_9GAMM|nr:MAG: pyridoxamine 5'-phosphate oxidase [SAR86 cluster bacterium]
MTHKFAETVFTKSVKAQQKAYGSLEHNEKLQENFGPNDEMRPREVQFIGKRDSFYLSTVSESGWPYVQHRGGPAGFLKVLNPKLLAYADFRGNTQLVSTGNLSVNDRCSLILMDYPNRRRLKVLGRIRMENAVDVEDNVLQEISDPEYGAVIERVFFIDLLAFDWNCPQHISPRYTEAEFLEKFSEYQSNQES